MLKKLTMSIFGKDKESSAQMAKDRLKIIIAHQRGDGGQVSFDMEALEAEIIQVIKKYVNIDNENLVINLDDDNSELDICIDLESKKEDGKSSKSKKSKK